MFAGDRDEGGSRQITISEELQNADLRILCNRKIHWPFLPGCFLTVGSSLGGEESLTVGGSGEN
jgi:hypothetical protein